MQTNFIALYRGQTVAEAHLVAVTAEPEIVARFIRELTGEGESPEEQPEGCEQRESLRLVSDVDED